MTRQNSRLLAAATNRNLPGVKRAIGYGADVNCVDHHGDTVLIIACRLNPNRPVVNFRIIIYLLGCGAEVNSVDKNGETPLLLLCHQYHVCSRYIGFDFCKRHNHFYWSQIGLALRLMLWKNADVNVRDKQGRTPLHVMTQCGYLELYPARAAEVLLDYGRNININAEDDSGNTPLTNASFWYCHRFMIGSLLNRGATISNKVITMINDSNDANKRIALILAGVDPTLITNKSGKVQIALNRRNMLRLCLLHLCRETIRHFIWHNNPGVKLLNVVPKLGLPKLMTDYVIDAKRFVNLECS